MNTESPNAKNLYARLPPEAIEAHGVCDALNEQGIACYVRCWHLDQQGWFVVNAQTYERMNFSSMLSEMPKLSIRNRRLMAQAAKQKRLCGCYFCLNTWMAHDIVDYAADGSGLCPACGTDALLVGVTNVQTLGAGLERWFCGASKTKLEIA